MDQIRLEQLLAGLPLGELRYHQRIGSTNSEALQMAKSGAPHLSVVVADEQTAGRGRLGRKWYTPAGTALAFSLVLNLDDPAKASRVLPASAYERLTALGAIAVSQALERSFGLEGEIKWPNDVLLNRRKVAGVLVETQWHGNIPLQAILGIGINVATGSVPPTTDLLYPATCVEAELSKPVERWGLLQAVITVLLEWWPRLTSPEFLQAWENRLAFRGEWVRVSTGYTTETTWTEGLLLGLDPNGGLKLRSHSDEVFTIQNGDLHLRPVDKLTE
jgi:BirA family biotin operon repressor/biotin-[acetyl-CoA-carboxylase] ligase